MGVGGGGEERERGGGEERERGAGVKQSHTYHSHRDTNDRLSENKWVWDSAAES